MARYFGLQISAQHGAHQFIQSVMMRIPTSGGQVPLREVEFAVFKEASQLRLDEEEHRSIAIFFSDGVCHSAAVFGLAADSEQLSADV